MRTGQLLLLSNCHIEQGLLINPFIVEFLHYMGPMQLTRNQQLDHSNASSTCCHQKYRASGLILAAAEQAVWQLKNHVISGSKHRSMCIIVQKLIPLRISLANCIHRLWCLSTKQFLIKRKTIKSNFICQ